MFASVRNNATMNLVKGKVAAGPTGQTAMAQKRKQNDLSLGNSRAADNSYATHGSFGVQGPTADTQGQANGAPWKSLQMNKLNLNNINAKAIRVNHDNYASSQQPSQGN